MGFENIDKIIYVAVFSALLISQFYFLATYRPEGAFNPQFKEWIWVREGSWELGWQVTSGANKPLIKFDNEVVLELSGWAGGILLDGLEERKTYWMHEYSVTFDENSIYHSWKGENYVIEQVSSIGGDQVIIRINVVPYPPYEVLRNVDLVFAFYNWEFDEVYLTDDSVIWTTSESPHAFKMEMLASPDKIEIHDVCFTTQHLFEKVTRRTLVAEFILSRI